MWVGIVGSEDAKFTHETEKAAKTLILELLGRPGVTGVVSGGCHLGGIDLWAERGAQRLGIPQKIFPSKARTWGGPAGYAERNLRIVRESDEVHCITLKALPPYYAGMRFKLCYHCGTDEHVKSGGCWTMMQARKAGKPGILHVIN